MLTIALEPEAAALYVKHLPVERNLETFSPGSKYIVVDVGGLVCVKYFFDLHVKQHRCH